MGQPVEEILDLGEEIGADLIVVGRRSIGLARRLVTGSVSGEISRRAPCPVLVVPDGGDAWPRATCS